LLRKGSRPGEGGGGGNQVPKEARRLIKIKKKSGTLVPELSGRPGWTTEPRDTRALSAAAAGNRARKRKKKRTH